LIKQSLTEIRLVILETSRELDVAKDGTRFVCCWDPTPFRQKREIQNLKEEQLLTPDTTRERY
jgi:hypothetical protein